ncbi:hypothetical protein Y032_0028g1641 [Ancylostoma ceylanicum]|uniref:Uncharacterized protein n=1 Tax=Ancylostoma ceylanicum TaxID=53326 RepID=A0A016USZ1_9BILA|nr:hypothetical protein Y032_0028g1641 [Ancylostoma ceylanicum]
MTNERHWENSTFAFSFWGSSTEQHVRTGTTDEALHIKRNGIRCWQIENKILFIEPNNTLEQRNKFNSEESEHLKTSRDMFPHKEVEWYIL